jgi:hypothetical protein
LEAGRDVNTIAVDIVPLNDHITDVHTNTEFHSAIEGHLDLPLSHAALDVKRALDGMEGACELDEQAVTHELHDATSVCGYCGIYQFFNVSL